MPRGVLKKIIFYYFIFKNKLKTNLKKRKGDWPPLLATGGGRPPHFRTGGGESGQLGLAGRNILLAQDCMLMQLSDQAKPSYVAKIKWIKVVKREGLRAMVLPAGGVDRRPTTIPRLQGGLPLRPLQPAERRHHRGQCTVHSFKSYTKLDTVGNDDFFCCFEYNSSTGRRSRRFEY